MRIEGIDHIQLAMPAGKEDAARSFYGAILEIPEVHKPPELAKRGGVWFENDRVKVHLGIDPDFRPALKAHPALLVQDLSALISKLRENGIEVAEAEPLPGYEHIYVADPFGNRIELMEPNGLRGAKSLTFSGRTVTCGPHKWDAGYPILEASQVEGCVCLILDYSALPKKRQAENLRAFTVDGQLLWIAEHPTPLGCYTGLLDKERVRVEIAANPTGPVAECFSGFLDTKSLLAYNIAGYQCLIDLASGKVIRMFFTK